MQFSKIVLAFAFALGVMSLPTGKKQNHHNKFIYRLNNITCSQYRGSRCPWAGTSLDWCQCRSLQAWFRLILSNRLLNERILLNGRAAIWSSKPFSIFQQTRFKVCFLSGIVFFKMVVEIVEAAEIGDGDIWSKKKRMQSTHCIHLKLHIWEILREMNLYAIDCFRWWWAATEL